MLVSRVVIQHVRTAVVTLHCMRLLEKGIYSWLRYSPEQRIVKQPAAVRTRMVILHCTWLVVVVSM